MEGQIKELYSITENLEKIISTIQQNVNFNIGLTWTILGVIIAAIGLATYFLLKTWFDARFKAESSKITNEINKYILENPQMLWVKGTGTIISIKNEGVNRQTEIFFSVSTKINTDLIIMSEFYAVHGNQKIQIENYKLKTEGNQVKVVLEISNNIPYNNYEFFIMWQNPLYFM